MLPLLIFINALLWLLILRMCYFIDCKKTAEQTLTSEQTLTLQKLDELLYKCTKLHVAIQEQYTILSENNIILDSLITSFCQRRSSGG
jgi:hypothetical protein